jgi:hypothetical protein
MHILYDIKNGHEYAKLCTSKRLGGKVAKDCTYLGRVIDKENGIYKNKERGVFTYNLSENSYGIPDPSYIMPPERKGITEKLILDFGDAFFLNSFFQSRGLSSVVDAIEYGNKDTVYSMLFYYILCSTANCHANDWWEGSYARILYPNANLTSQRISEFLSAIGNERTYRSFFKEYLKLITGGKNNGVNILIDSSGLPNSIHFPLTAISNHNG